MTRFCLTITHAVALSVAPSFTQSWLSVILKLLWAITGGKEASCGGKAA
ncbi:unnamed protein product [[Actinomadura] parvosata subsp. kistnae]|nr:unnamed protein product [Actinomadura parvosata subsp. kistnae]